MEYPRTTALSRVAILILAANLVACGSVEWALVNYKVRHDFPDVRRTNPKQVADALHDPKGPNPVLLDVRTKAEYQVSHIHGARRVEPGSDASAIDLPHDTPIVTYCSVGYRSGAFAKKLNEAGYKNVQNMGGSIFEWANDGYPIEQDGHPVKKVHPYNARWGKLLKQSLRADVPPAGKGI